MLLGIPRETGSDKGWTTFISFPLLHSHLHPSPGSAGWFTFPRPHSRLRAESDATILVSRSRSLSRKPGSKTVSCFTMALGKIRGNTTEAPEAFGQS